MQNWSHNFELMNFVCVNFWLWVVSFKKRIFRLEIDVIWS